MFAWRTFKERGDKNSVMREIKLPNAEEIGQAEAQEKVKDIKEEAVSEAMTDGMEEMEAQQQVNEALANIPESFEVNGRMIELHSKSAREMVRIDKAIMELLKVQYKRETLDIQEGENFWEEIDALQDSYYESTFEVLFLIINRDSKNPEFDKEWIMDNIDLMDGGVGEQILDGYNEKCSAQNFFQKVLRSRKF